MSLPPQVVRQYQEIQQEAQRLVVKISELEMDRNEHRLVEETLEPLDPQRRAYRLVGEILVERTVDEVLPTIRGNREHVSTDDVECCNYNYRVKYVRQ
jgi:prefoldin subunit 2